MKLKFSYLALFVALSPLHAQQKDAIQKEADRVKMEHAQIGIFDDEKSTYTHTENPGAQWYAHAGFGMFIHWSIASIKQIDLSWPMMAGTQIGWSKNKPSQDSIDRFVQAGDFFAGHACKKANSCITPMEYWEQAKFFNPSQYDPESWAKAAKAAGMTYMVLTTRHHDGFALWPSNYGTFNTKNYMGGRDLVKEYVLACRKYGLKVGLYYSGPDWYFNRDFQNFLYWGLYRDYKNVPSVDVNLAVRTTLKTDAEKQLHYDSVAVYLKGQIEELLSNYGQIDMIWFDGGPDIPRGNSSWSKCITMKQIHELQPGIVVSPRFFGYGDYKTFEGDNALPTEVQKQWAELCVTSTTSGWGITNFPMKSVNKILTQRILCCARNTNYLLNYSPSKEGVLPERQLLHLDSIAAWMKVNGKSVANCTALNGTESANVPASANGKSRFLFLLSDNKCDSIQFTTSSKIKNVKYLTTGAKIKFQKHAGGFLISTKSLQKSDLPQVLAVELK